MASLYLVPEIRVQDAVAGAVVSVTGDEARHAISVARLRVGEPIAVGDGRGLIVEGIVSSTDAAVLSVTVDRVRREERPRPEFWLAQALAKGDRDELAIQTATELGVFGVIPWAAERSVVRWDDAKAEKGRERWRSIVREASKQAIRAWVPEVAALADIRALCAFDGTILPLEPTGSARLTEVDLAEAARILLVVGPEGGFAPRELDTLEAAGATHVRLGPEVLRTSSAGPAALAVLNARLGRW